MAQGLKALSVLLLFFGLAVSSISMAADQTQEGQRHADSIAQFAAKAIYNLDEDQLRAVLEPYLNSDQNIRGLQISETIENEKILFYFRDDQERPVYGTPLPEATLKLGRFEALAYFEGENIGKVELFYHLPSDLKFTAEESRWLKNNPEISIGVEEWYPFIRTEQGGQPGGIAGDFIDLVLKKTGLKMRVVNADWSSLLASFRQGEIDLLPATYYTDERATFGRYSSPYFSGKEFLYVRKDNFEIKSFEDLRGKKLAIPADFGTIPKIRAKYPDIEIVETKDQRDSLYSVLNSAVDATFESQIVMEEIIRKDLMSGIQAIVQTDFDASKLYFFSHKDKPLLQSILTKALDSISEEERRAIINNWVSPGNSQVAEINNLKDISDQKALLSLPAIVAMGVGLLILFAIILYVLSKLRSEKDLSSFFGASSFRISILIGLSVLVLGVAVMNWLAIEESKKRNLVTLENELRLVLHSSIERLNNWVQERQSFLKQLGRDPTLVQITQDLLAVSRTEEELVNSIPLKRARDYFASNKQFGSAGFFIVSPDLISIGSMRDANIGTRNFISEIRPEFINRAFQGEAVLVPPIRSDVALENEKRKPLSMFFAAPISDANGNVLAVMTERLRPSGPLSKVLHLGRIGLSGETYAFNGEGKMVSQSRFQNQFVEMGLLTKEDLENGELALIDPGRNLTKKQNAKPRNQARDFTFMVQEALASRKKSRSVIAVNTEGYRDYRGVLVVGAWKWLEDFELGIATEIDFDEAMANFHAFRFNLLVISIIATTMAVGATLFTLILGQRSHRSLSRARDQLEDRVKERTRDLQNSEKRIRSIIENAADGIIVISAEGIVQSFSPAAEQIFGYGPDEVVGNNIKMLMPEPYKSEHDGYLANYFRNGVPKVIGQNREVVGRHKDGSEFPMDLAVGKTVLGEETIFTGIVRDISIRKKAEKQLKDAYDVISSSIEYASRIQQSALPDHRLLGSLVVDYFVWWEPRDVVGGDLYWVGAWGDGCLVILGDCTGHGVPGAFMTLISIAAIERAVAEVPGGDVAGLITRSHQYIQVMLGQHYAGGDSDDGIELGACYFVPDEPQMKFAGARFHLLIMNEDEAHFVKGTKAGMGYRHVPYTQGYKEEIVDLKPGQRFYLSSDGLIDQVGGPRRRMMGKKKVVQILEDSKHLSMEEQKQNLQKALKEHQGEESRRDDISMIGFQFS